MAAISLEKRRLIVPGLRLSMLAFTTFAIGVAYRPLAVLAEDREVIELGTVSDSGRARLVDPAIDAATIDIAPVEQAVNAESFSWASLVKHGPAAGENPKVGNPAKGSYFDFKDGQPRPFYIVGSAK